MKTLPCFPTLFLGITLVTPVLGVVIDYVAVGKAGNPNDSTGYGAVPYNYKIAKNETTIGQYAEFLNAVAKSDPYSLYSTNMAGYTPIAGIARSGSAGSYSYSVIPGTGNKPITFVTWFDAARFCNWIHNGQGSGGTENGAYTLNGATSGIILKNAAAKVWIPSEDEWYKAAYYDPTKGGSGGYWPYPTQSNALAGNTIGVANSANYFDGDYVGPYPGMALTDVGAYGANSDSFYGTNDQGGNVSELNDAVVATFFRGRRGGAYANQVGSLASSANNSTSPSSEDDSTGFRVASSYSFVITLLPVFHGLVTGNTSPYLSDTTATLAATPSPGYLFTGWTGHAIGNANPLSVLMNADKTIGANFTPDNNDTDGDGLTNYQEIVEYGTNPALPDTDGDGAKDGADAFPLDPAETLDTDRDGTGDNADTDDDGDGYSDTDEINIHHTNPKRADSDGDGLTDPAEIQTHHTNPNVADTDNDGLRDGEELTTYHTNPLIGDTDGDGFLDGYEVLTGKLPLDPLDKPALVAEARTAIEFTFPAAVGKTYRIEASMDLAAWEIVESGIAGTGGQVQRFYSTRSQAKRYFRVEEQAP